MNDDNKRKLAQRLGYTAMFWMVRGLASAAGGALVTGVIWWIQNH
ncbi:hypothetical protein Aros01_08647 [Streptosporangium roseum]